MLSIVLATHNEEKNIEKCLSAVKDIADEIVVVDGESTDETVKLAKKFGAKIIATTNKSNFHINKQMGIDKAKGDLILQLDADEVVDSELKEFIKQTHSVILERSKTVIPDSDLESKQAKFVNRDMDPRLSAQGGPFGREDDKGGIRHQASGINHQYSAWWIKRKNLFLGKFLTKGGQYPDPVIRLFIKGKAYLPAKDVHEQMKVDGLTGMAQGHLIHYANPTFADYLRKFNTYTSFKATQLKEKKLKINFSNSINYLLWKPFATWFSIFIRHKGFVDGLPGFVFALFSGYHHLVAYLKLWELKHVDQ